MDDLLQITISESQDDEIKEVATSIHSLDLTPEEMETNLIISEKFFNMEEYDKKD